MQIFISYTHRHEEDENVALELYDIFNTLGYKAWIDVRDIPNFTTRERDGWQTEIDNGLQTSQAMIALMSNESIESKNVEREWLWAKNNDVPTIWVRVREFDKIKLSHQLGQPNWLDYHSENFRKRLKDNFDLIASIEGGSSKPQTKDFIYEIVEIISLLEKDLSSLPKNKRSRMIRGREKLTKEIICWRIYQEWIVNILKPTLDEFILVGMNSDMQPNLSVQYHESTYKTIKYDGNKVRKIYDKLGMFLVLGEPGSGKSVFLLQLATLLMKEYLDCKNKTNCNDDHIKIPLILNLSSWGSKPDYDEVSLDDWIALECEKLYRIDKEIFADLLSYDSFILLLDGLDEIPKEKLRDRIQKINTYREKENTTNIIVCSREQDYRDFIDEYGYDCKLKFAHSVQLLPLDETQVNSYFVRNPNQETYFSYLYGLNKEIKELATIPLFMVMMARVYSLRNYEGLHSDLKEETSSEIISKDIIDKYTNIKERNRLYTIKKGKKDNILGWLTERSRSYGVIFRLDRMTVDWFEDRWMRPFHQGVLFLLIFVMPIGIWLAMGVELSGIIGGIILAISVGIFSRIIWYDFFREEYFYHDIHYQYLADKIEPLLQIQAIQHMWFYISNLIFSPVFFTNRFSLEALKRDNALRRFLMVGGVSLWLLGTIFFLNQIFSTDIFTLILLSTVTLAVIFITLLLSRPETTTTRAFVRKATLMMIIALGLGIWLYVLISPPWLIAIPLMVALFFGIARVVQLQLFGIFFWLKFQVRYETFMQHMVNQNVFRNFAGGYTYRHDYFFQQQWERKPKKYGIEHKFYILLNEFSKLTDNWQNPIDGIDKEKMLDEIYQLGAPVIPIVVNRFINAKNNYQIQFFAELLIKLGENSALELLRRGDLFDEQKGEINNYSTLHFAIDVFGKLKYVRAVDKLVELFNSHERAVIRVQIATALGNIGTDRACNALIQSLDNTDKDVLDAVVASLNKLKDMKPNAMDALVKAGRVE